ncbi:putative uncharacterized protein DDB_G0282133 isoform X2 [Gordionus sp. m RMFG-2023]|uniref:putative uncharacterized protein DDB_G0282133 isoform X2 n=1 Tax=Gordionus sp. m RMFG-2023 TaxID=3053472 RepID=UPI0031FD1E6F
MGKSSKHRNKSISRSRSRSRSYSKRKDKKCKDERKERKRSRSTDKEKKSKKLNTSKDEIQYINKLESNKYSPVKKEKTSKKIEILDKSTSSENSHKLQENKKRSKDYSEKKGKFSDIKPQKYNHTDIKEKREIKDKKVDKSHIDKKKIFDIAKIQEQDKRNIKEMAKNSSERKTNKHDISKMNIKINADELDNCIGKFSKPIDHNDKKEKDPSKLLQSTLRNESITQFTKFCQNLSVDEKSSYECKINHPYSEPVRKIISTSQITSIDVEKSSYSSIPALEYKSSILTQISTPSTVPLLSSQLLTTNLLSLLPNQSDPIIKQKIFPISSGKSHYPSADSQNIQNYILERSQIVKSLTVNPSDEIGAQKMKEIDTKIAEWHTKVTTNPEKPLEKKSQNPNDAYVPDLPTDYLMRDHNYKPSNVALKLMNKMGWKPGKTLGRMERDIDDSDSIKLELKYDRIGLRSLSEFAKDERFQASLVKHPVSALNEICQKMKWSDPEFSDLSYNPFLMQVIVKGRKYVPPAPSESKKVARMEAAKFALIQMGFLSDSSILLHNNILNNHEQFCNVNASGLLPNYNYFFNPNIMMNNVYMMNSMMNNMTNIQNNVMMNNMTNIQNNVMMNNMTNIQNNVMINNFSNMNNNLTNVSNIKSNINDMTNISGVHMNSVNNTLNMTNNTNSLNDMMNNNRYNMMANMNNTNCMDNLNPKNNLIMHSMNNYDTNLSNPNLMFNMNMNTLSNTNQVSNNNGFKDHHNNNPNFLKKVRNIYNTPNNTMSLLSNPRTSTDYIVNSGSKPLFKNLPSSNIPSLMDISLPSPLMMDKKFSSTLSCPPILKNEPGTSLLPLPAPVANNIVSNNRPLIQNPSLHNDQTKKFKSNPSIDWQNYSMISPFITSFKPNLVLGSFNNANFQTSNPATLNTSLINQSYNINSVQNPYYNDQSYL